MHAHAGVLPEDVQAVLPAVVGHRLAPREMARFRDAGPGRPARARRGAGALSAHGCAVSLRGSCARGHRGTHRRLDPAAAGPGPATRSNCSRERIYILPTPLGLAYAAMVFAMLLGGMNYNNNLGLGLAFLLVSLGLVAMHHCHGTLSGLVLRLLATESAFVGQDASLPAAARKSVARAATAQSKWP